MSLEGANYLLEVRDQYENYPYPRRFPEDERKRFFRPFFDSLEMLNHYCYEGKRNFYENFRVLVAGGGTGDATIYLAEQLRDTKAEVFQVDLSSASLAIAKERARIRGLKNITFIHNSLLELAKMGIGKFDYINCSGVLHHLKVPEDGLASLKSVLNDDGVMGLMLYGKYGRIPLYHMQELMRRVNKGENDMQQKVENTKTLMKILPPSNWTKRSESSYDFEINQSGDIGIYDLFLHPQDRAYSIPEVYEFTRSCDLKLIRFLDLNGCEKLVFLPSYYIKEKALLDRIGKMGIEEQQAIAELIICNMDKHSFYVAKSDKKEASFSEYDNVPMFSSLFYEEGINMKIHDAIKNIPSLTMTKHIVSLTLINKKYTAAILRHVDGKKTIREIIQAVNQEVDGSQNIYNEILKDFEELYNSLNMFNWILLKHKSSPLRVKSEMEFQKIFKQEERQNA